MSFIYSPTRVFMPPVPAFFLDANNSEMWVGQGADRDYVVLRVKLQWRMFHNTGTSWDTTGSVALFPTITCGGDVLYPVFRDCGGFFYYASRGAALWFVEGMGWVYMVGGAPGYTPEEYTDENGNPAGDNFYVVDSFKYSDGGTLKLKPRGALEGSSDLEATFSWPRWDGPSTPLPFGVYEPKEGARGTRVLGSPRWRDSNGKYYVRSIKKTNGRWAYGDIHFDDWEYVWVIGAVGAVNGWYEGEEPSLTSPVTFRFRKPEGSDITGDDLTVSFVDYVEGNEKEDALVGEVAIWHS